MSSSMPMPTFAKSKSACHIRVDSSVCEQGFMRATVSLEIDGALMGKREELCFVRGSESFAALLGLFHGLTMLAYYENKRRQALATITLPQYLQPIVNADCSDEREAGFLASVQARLINYEVIYE